MTSVFCNQCGRRSPTSLDTCPSCDAPLPWRDSTLTSDPTDSALPQPQGQHVASGPAGLLVVRGDNVGSRFGLHRQTTTLGRDPASDVFLADVTVSRHHCQIVRRDDEFVVRDVGSLNGTYVNGERVDSTALAHGDELQVGKFRLVFVDA